jgi:hypothetical protein
MKNGIHCVSITYSDLKNKLEIVMNSSLCQNDCLILGIGFDMLIKNVTPSANQLKYIKDKFSFSWKGSFYSLSYVMRLSKSYSLLLVTAIVSVKAQAQSPSAARFNSCNDLTRNKAHF